MKRALSVVAAMCSASALACSGPGAQEAMARSMILGWVSLLLTIAVVTAATVLGRRRKYRAWRWAWAWLLVVLHPGIWVGAYSGDCGAMRTTLCITFFGGAIIWAAFFRRPDIYFKSPS